MRARAKPRRERSQQSRGFYQARSPFDPARGDGPGRGEPPPGRGDHAPNLPPTPPPNERLSPHIRKIRAAIASVAAVGSVVSGLAGFWQVSVILRSRPRAPPATTSAPAPADEAGRRAAGTDDASHYAGDRAAVERLLAERKAGVQAAAVQPIEGADDVRLEVERRAEQRRNEQMETALAADRARMRLLMQRRLTAAGEEAARLDADIRQIVRRQVETLAALRRQWTELDGPKSE